MSPNREVTMSIRLSPEDQVALAWLNDYVRATAGRGISVSASDTVRWCLHTCRAGLEVEVERQNAQSDGA